MKFVNHPFIFVFFICLIALSCAPRAKKVISPAQAWAIDVANATEASSTLVAEFVARELSLGPKQKEKFVNDYVVEREAVVKRQAEARKTGNRQDFMLVIRKNEEGFLRVMKVNLNPDQIKIAINILRPDGMLGGSMTGSLDGSVNSLIRGKVAKNKIEKALPILVTYHQQFAALNAKALSEGISPDDRMDKVIELRVATAKKLVPIIGEEAADFWLDLRTRKGISIKK